MINKNTGLSEEDLIPKIWIDTILPPEYLNMEFINELKRLEPFGKGNEKPVFAAKDVTILSARIVGAKENVLIMNFITDSGFRISGVSFEMDEFQGILKKSQEGKKVSMIYDVLNKVILDKETKETIVSLLQLA